MKDYGSYVANDFIYCVSSNDENKQLAHFLLVLDHHIYFSLYGKIKFFIYQVLNNSNRF